MTFSAHCIHKEPHHSKYGQGVVKNSRHKGFELQVTFEDGLIRWVRSDELTEKRIKAPIHIEKGDSLAVNPIQKTSPKVQQELLSKYVQLDLFEK